MSDAIEFQWALLHRIPREPRKLSTPELFERMKSAGFTMSKRTVERNLASLAASHLFGLVAEAGSGATVWYFPKSAAGLNIPGLDSDAALALVLARDHLEPLLPASTLAALAPYFQRAETALDAESGHRRGAWRRKVRVLTRGPRLTNPKVLPEVHIAVTDALLRERQLQTRYRGAQAKSEHDEVLNPLGLVVKEGVIYLIATTTWGDSSPFQYALHRFASASVLDTPAKQSTGFSVDSYVDQELAFSYPRSVVPLSLVVDFEAKVIAHLNERPLATDQRMTEQPDGRVRMTASVADTDELRWWLQGFGANVEVIAPASLRLEFRRTARLLAGRYAKRARLSTVTPTIAANPGTGDS